MLLSTVVKTSTAITIQPLAPAELDRRQPVAGAPRNLPRLRPLSSWRRAGHTLLVALTAATIVSSLVGVAMLRTSATARIASRANNYAASARAVDGVLEYAYGAWKAAVVQKDGPLNITTDSAVLLAAGPSLPGFDYSTALRIDPVDAYGSPATVPVPAQIYLPGYPGWRGYSYNYVASVRLQNTQGPTSNRPGPTGGKRIFQYIEVPLFQSMYFFEHTLEIYRPAPMIVSGLVHSNSRLLLSGMADTAFVDIEFTGNLSYAGTTPTTAGYSTIEPPIGGPEWAGFTAATAPANMEAPTYSNGGQAQQVASVERYEPLGQQPAAVLSTADTNPNNDSFMEIIEPPVAGYPDPPEIAKRRLYNKAGILMNINGTTVTVTTQNGTTLTAAQITSLKAAFTGKNTMYDQREGKTVDIANLNVSAMTTVLNAAAGFNGVLYVDDTTPVTLLDPEPKTIRLKSGGVLPNTGLTVASQNPVYVQGDYNTGTTTNPTSVPANSTGNPNNTSSPVVSGYTRKPASIAADAVMLLSNSWSDANASLAVTSRNASNTTYNTAILAGFMPSGYDPDGAGGVAAYGYSGGANNFPRFLENWTNKSCTYFGSMVELFPSKVFTGKWDTGVIYRAPNRRWNFDTNFITTSPPGSLDAVAVGRGGWMRY